MLPPDALPHRIYLVEDHPVMREALAALLNAEPDLGVVGLAASAEDAALDLETEPCDLVVTDVRLPGISGFDLTERLQGTRPALPVLVVSAHDGDFYGDRARAVGAAGFLSKRGLAATLAPAIREALDGVAA